MTRNTTLPCPPESTDSALPERVFNQDSPNLDLLRAFAVLLVLLDHWGTEIAPQVRHHSGFGNFGVLLFFIHTSLVLMLSLERMHSKNGSVPLRDFYIRRFFRIYPLSIITVLIVVVSGFCGPWRSSILTIPEIWGNLTLTMNIFPWMRFAINPLWSLPYEVDMYILLPLLFLFALRFKSAWATFGLMLACGAFALIQPHYAIFGRLDLIEYTGCFLPGIVAYQLSSRPRYRWPAWRWPLFLILWSILYVGLTALHSVPHFLLRWPVCLVVGLMLPQFLPIPDGLIRRGAAIVAKYSYGIYLTHTFALHIAFVLMLAYPFIVRMAAFSVMLVVFPFAAYYLIEKPGIELGKRLVMRLSPRRVTPRVAALPAVR